MAVKLKKSRNKHFFFGKNMFLRTMLKCRLKINQKKNFFFIVLFIYNKSNVFFYTMFVKLNLKSNTKINNLKCNKFNTSEITLNKKCSFGAYTKINKKNLTIIKINKCALLRMISDPFFVVVLFKSV